MTRTYRCRSTWLFGLLFLLLIYGCCFHEIREDGAQPAALQPEPGKAAVTGRLLGLRDRKPISDQYLYLGSFVGKSGQIAAVNHLKAPRTVTRPDGRFIFADITPGTYFLVTVGPPGLVLLQNPETGREIKFEAGPGKVIDLGAILFSPIKEESTPPSGIQEPREDSSLNQPKKK